MIANEIYMLRAFELAVLGLGNVSPNPLVGCVIVHNDRIIGEGYHQVFGGAHAEVNAIKSVQNKELLKEADLYVTLEPCSHFGKTPPCADLIVKHQVKRVIISNLDPNPKVSGNGVNILKEAGIAVVTNFMDVKGEQINKRYFHFRRKNRPFVILKWAETFDGFVARKDYSSKWISNASSRQLVHKWRAEEDAIMVGTNTAKYDDPSLTVREWSGKDPLRIVIDKQLQLSEKLKLFSDGLKTVCFNEIKSEEINSVKYVAINKENLLPEVLSYLYNLGTQSIIIEGGSFLLHSFIKAGLWDEARIFIGANTFGEGIKSPEIIGQLEKEINVQGDTLLIKRNIN